MAYNGFSKAVTAALLFKASSSFDAAVTKPGCNVSNLLSAIGAQGLTKLWHQLTVFAWTVSLSQVYLAMYYSMLYATTRTRHISGCDDVVSSNICIQLCSSTQAERILARQQSP